MVEAEIMVHSVHEYYRTVCDTVCSLSELSEEEILNSNKENCVDARYVLVFVLSERLTDEEISRLTKMSRTFANKVRNTFTHKSHKYSIRCLLCNTLQRVHEFDMKPA